MTVAGRLKVALKSSLSLSSPLLGILVDILKQRKTYFPFLSEKVACAMALASLSEIK